MKKHVDTRTYSEWVREGTFSKKQLQAALKKALAMPDLNCIYLGQSKGKLCFLLPLAPRVHA